MSRVRKITYVAGNYVVGNYVAEVCGNLRPRRDEDVTRDQWPPGAIRCYRARSITVDPYRRLQVGPHRHLRVQSATGSHHRRHQSLLR